MSQHPLSLLCIEPRFPGRLGPVIDWLVRRRGYRAQFFCASAEPRTQWPEATGHGLDVILFNVGGVAREGAVPWGRALERGLCYAYGCIEVLQKRQPHDTDLVLGRSAGLGSTLFVPTLMPGVPIVQFFDYFLHAHANDLAAEPDAPRSAEYRYWRRTAPAMDLLDLENGVHPWTATAWQRDLFPPEYRADFTILPPGCSARFLLGAERPRVLAGRSLPPEARVVSFVARHLDRLRGFDRFVLLANRLLAADPNVICVAAGDPQVQRGLDVPFHGQDFAAYFLQQTPLHDPERFWLLGSVPPATVAELLAASTLHVYPSRPYPVALSLFEALAAGCVVLAWDSDPVREVLTSGQTGLLVSPADLDEAERQARAVLADPAAYAPLGRAAAALAAERYTQEATLPVLADWLGRLAARRR
jgi:glycosyltransferase involved in cell wall biosynthesis